MKSRPILFSAPMVRALLDGTKTQTRRIVKPQPLWVGEPSVPFKTTDADPKGIINCPYGITGSLLWVRETFRVINGQTQHGIAIDCRAGPEEKWNRMGDFLGAGQPWKPSIFMPRWASRLTLRITDVRVERLQEISEADAIAEGCDRHNHATKWPDGDPGYIDDVARRNYCALWESINGAGSWEANSWVWAITFDVIKANVDKAPPS